MFDFCILLFFDLHLLQQGFCAQEHHIIDRNIRDLAVCCDLAGVGEDIGLFHMIILVLHEGAQRAVDGVVLAGLDLDRDGGQAVIVVDQEIDLAFSAVIVMSRTFQQVQRSEKHTFQYTFYSKKRTNQ